MVQKKTVAYKSFLFFLLGGEGGGDPKSCFDSAIMLFASKIQGRQKAVQRIGITMLNQLLNLQLVK